MPTLSHIAAPCDSRCQWWSKIVPRDWALSVDLSKLTGAGQIPGHYLKKGSDHELDVGTFLVDAEANHHKKMRGWTYRVGLVVEDDKEQEGCRIRWWVVNIADQKKEMKDAGVPASWLKGSGSLAGAIRWIKYLLKDKDPAPEEQEQEQEQEQEMDDYDLAEPGHVPESAQ